MIEQEEDPVKVPQDFAFGLGIGGGFRRGIGWPDWETGALGGGGEVEIAGEGFGPIDEPGGS